MDNNNQIIIYQTDDDQTQIDVRLENETVWLTQAQMAEPISKGQNCYRSSHSQCLQIRRIR